MPCCVSTVSNRLASQSAGSRKTLTPSVPDLINGGQTGTPVVMNGEQPVDMAHYGGTVGNDESFPPPPSPLVKPKSGSSSGGKQCPPIIMTDLFVMYS